jgi:signal transduction histidine kinase/CheY-like chemotaxis protein
MSVFGVETVTAQWAEWITSVPLICYMAVAIKDTPVMSNEDIAIVVLSCVAVVCGFLENFNQMPIELGIVIFIVGTFAMCSTLGLGLLSSWRRYRVISIDSKQRGEDFDDLIAQATKQRSLSVLLFLVYPCFPVIYILGIVKVLDRDAVFIAFQIAGVAAKLLFVSSIADAHMGLSRIIDKLRLSAEEAANTTRRTFLRYVFDQIRRPLNTVVMGCVVAGEDCAHNRWTPMSKGALDMMSAASALISDTVEDVFALQKIEEGSLELTKSRFTVADLISGSIQIVKPFADSKLINISVNDVGKPNRGYLGDHTRLENVLVNLLLQSIKYCPVGSQIEIKLVEQDYALVPHHFTNTRVVAPTSVLPSTTKFAERKQSFSEVIPNAINALANAVGGGDFKKSHVMKKLNAANMMRVAAAHTRSDPYDDTKKRMCEVTLRVEDQGAPLLPQQDHAGLLKTKTYLQLEALQEGRGTGVGMVLAKEIILLTGGRFIAESVNTGPTPGNRFGFTIPFELAPNDGETSLHIIPITDSYKISNGAQRPRASILARDNGVVVAGSNPSTESIASYLPRRVLIISDAHDDCRMLQTIFEMRGIPSDVVENGAEAVKVLSAKRDMYDVIFVSYSMSGMDGEKTSKLIRDGGFPKLIFGLAGELSERSMSSFLMSGVDVIILGNLLRAGQLDAIFSMIRKKGLLSSPKAKYVLEQRFKNEFVIRKIVI